MAVTPMAPGAGCLADEGGQATFEYILLIAIVVSLYVALASWASGFGLMRKLTRPITQDFAQAYQVGDPKGKGFEDGAPERHPRARGCEGCFRIFINPDFK